MDNGEISYRRFLDGDNDGIAEIVRDYKDGLILYINGYVKNIYVAEELTEDTFVKLVIKRPLFSGKSSFKTWIYAIGRNITFDYLRKHSKEIQNRTDKSDINDEELLEASYLKEERKIIVHKAMGKLKDEYRQVLWLSYLEGFSGKEISKIMKKNLHSVETLTYRAKQALKKELLKEGFKYEDL